MIMDLNWWNELAGTTQRGVKQIHEKGVDAFVVLVGGFGTFASSNVKESQDAARRWVDTGIARERVRIKRVTVPSSRIR